MQEKQNLFGALFIHYSEFLALQLSSGENTIGKCESKNNNCDEKKSITRQGQKVGPQLG